MADANGHIAGLGHTYPSTDIPQTLAWNSTCATFDEYKNILIALYSTLRVKQAANNVGNYVATGYCSLTEALLRNNIRNAHPTFTDARATPVWLYRILRMLVQPPTATRNQLAGIVPSLSNANVNAVLKDHHHNEGTDALDNPSLPVEYFQRWITDAYAALLYCHKKARTAYEFIRLYDDYCGGLDNLTNRVGDMLLNLLDRNTVNQLATDVGEIRSKMELACESLVKDIDIQQAANSQQIFLNFEEAGQVDIQQIKAKIANHTLWSYHILMGGAAANFRATSNLQIKEQSNKLQPLIKDIRSYAPSSLDRAKEKAANVKASVVLLVKDMEKFADTEDLTFRNLSTASNLMKKINIYRDRCEQLSMEGVAFDEPTLGTTSKKMDEYYILVHRFITDEEIELKKKEQRDRLEANEILKTAPAIELPKLRGVGDWLNFKASLEKIMPYHQSDIIKCTLVRKALMDKADISRCQNLKYDGIINYLNTRYNDASLIPRLVDRMLILKPAGDSDLTSYNNLTEFLSCWSQLELHNGCDRIDSFVREKLINILLTRNLQHDFLKDNIAQEKKWKEESAVTDELDDGVASVASTSFSVAQGEEFEVRRRESFVSAMKVYCEMVRRIVTTSTTKDPVKKPFQRKSPIAVNASYAKDKSCPACNSSHHTGKSMANCQKFRAMSAQERFDFATTNNICKRCLFPRSDGKHAKGCQRWTDDPNKKCKICERRGHCDLLHLGNKGSSNTASANSGNNRKKRRIRSTKRPRSNKDGATASVNCTWVQQSSTDSFLSKAEEKLDVRMFLSACSNVTVALPRKQMAIILALLDIGSGLNFVTLTKAKELNLAQIAQWQGTIGTLNGENEGVFPVFSLPVKDVKGNIHNISMIGVPSIGNKAPLPTSLFHKLCKHFKVDPSLVQQTSGDIHAIIGLDSHSLLSKVDETHMKNVNSDYPGVAIHTTPLSPQYMLVGAVGPTLAENADIATRMYNIAVSSCFMVSSIMSNVEQSLHNHPHDDYSSYQLQVPEQKIDSVQLPIVLNGTESHTQVMSLLEIKKTAAVLSHLDAAALPQLMCPGCQLVVSKCFSCKYLNSEASLKDLEELEIIKQNMRKVPDPADESRFYIMCDYVFKDKPQKLYAPSLTNRDFAKRSAIRLRNRLIKENLVEPFHKEMLKSINNGHFVEVSGDVKKLFDTIGVECFICFNYVIKQTSLTQGCRPVSDSTAYHKSGDLNSNLIAGCQSINNPLHILWKWSYGPIGWTADFSRAYRSVLTGDTANAARRFFWFSNPSDETSIQEYCLVRLNYGDSPSSAVLEEAIREYISPQCQTELARNILCWNRYVDDTLYSFSSETTMRETELDIVQASSTANFLVKHCLHSGSVPVEDDDSDFTNVLGVKWYFEKDLVGTPVRFNTFPRKRGMPTGPDVNEEVAQNTMITKIIMCRLAGQSFSYTQAYLLPVTMALRILYSKVSVLTSEWNHDVSGQDDALDKEVRKVLMSLVNFPERIKTAERAVCPTGYKPFRLVISSDGSSYAASACMYVLVINDEGHIRSTIVAARGKIVKDTVPTCELVGASMGVAILDDYVQNMPALHDCPLDVILVCDSLCICYSLNPSKLFKKVKTRNSCFVINKQLQGLVTSFPKITISYCHIFGKENPSDLASKITPDPVQAASSQMWREGPNFFKDPQWPSSEIVFLKIQDGEPVHYSPPVAQQHADNFSCIVCSDDKDFCGSMTTFCQDCQTQDPHCISASHHEDLFYNQSSTSYQVTPDNAMKNFPDDDSDDALVIDTTSDDGDDGDISPPGDGNDDGVDHDDYPAILPRINYIRMMINSSSLYKILGVIIILTRLKSFFRARRISKKRICDIFHSKRGAPCEYRSAWRILVRSSQHHFPPCRISSWYPVTDSNKIIRAKTRFTMDNQNVELFSPPIISHSDHRLTTILIRHAHTRYLNGELRRVHLPKNITVSNIRSGNYAVEITHINRVVKAYINECISCTRQNSEPIKTALGKPRWATILDQTSLPFRVISLDPIGPFPYRVLNGRGPSRKLWILVISCVLTSAVSMVPMESYAKASVYQSLHQHCLRYINPTIIYGDAGTNLRLNPNDQQWYAIFGDSPPSVNLLGTEEFHANFVESKIKIIKKILRSSLQTRSTTQLPAMTIFQYYTLCESLSTFLNSRPIFESLDGRLIITPNHILKYGISLQDMVIDTTNGTLDDSILRLEDKLFAVVNILQQNAKQFFSSVKHSLLADTSNKRRLRDNHSSLPQRGDVVMVQRLEEYSLGVVEKVSGQFAWVRRCKNRMVLTEKINFRKFFILHRPYPHSTPPAATSEIIEHRKSKGHVQHRVSQCGNDTFILMPNSFDDVILNGVNVYYSIGPDGNININ